MLKILGRKFRPSGWLGLFLILLLLPASFAQVKSEREPNNTREEANEVQLGETVEGFIEAEFDEDFYKLVVNKPGKSIIRVDVSGAPDVQLVLRILDAEGNQLEFIDETGPGEPEALIDFGVTEAVYYLKVEGTQEKAKTAKYVMTTKFLRPWQEDEEFEVNDEMESATGFKLAQAMHGLSYPRGDRDWFVINIPEPGLDFFIVEALAQPKINLQLSFYDSDGKKLNDADLGEAGEKEVFVRLRQKPGKFYVMVWSYDSSDVEKYTLRAEMPAFKPASPEEVREALRKALDWLAANQTAEGYWENPYYYQNPGISGLALMAFLGGKCVPKDYTKNLRAAIEFIKTKYHPSSNYKEGSEDAALYGGSIYQNSFMYEHAIATLAFIEALVELDDLSLEPIAEEAVNLIIRAQNTEHKPQTLGGPINLDDRYYGGWRYEPNQTYSDISVSGWQIIALKAALNAGFRIPQWSFTSAAKYLRSLYIEAEHSFGYEDPSHGTCTRAGIGILGLQLCGFPKDPLIAPALGYLHGNAPVWEFENPGDGFPFYYWYYGTRAMLLAGGEDWRVWKAWMCRLLVDNQDGDGSWKPVLREENVGKAYTTALGALILEFCCGHIPAYMSPQPKRREITSVRVEFEKGEEREATKNVELILDASNSMWGQIGGEAKIAIARRVLAQIIEGLPDSLNVGLRVYGHRYGLNDKRACQDTELLVSIAPLNKAQLIDTINKIKLMGKTPLVYSVLEAIKDFETIKNGSIILITDGIESCGGDIYSIGPALRSAGLELRVNIVGFDIKEADARRELEAIAESTEGRYLDARDAKELLSSLEQTLQLEFFLLDEKGTLKARGLVGEAPVRIAEGSYTLRVTITGQPIEIKALIRGGEKARFVLKKVENKWHFEKQ
ncbi:MAG: hypothetical protein AB1715_00690 [Acidobacteriota bacterium]